MIYFIQAEGVGHIKIGFTDGDDALTRLAMLQTGSPVTLRLIGTMPGTMGDEKDLHRRFAAHRVTGEWFKPVAELLDLIKPTEATVCDGVGISEATVSIRILTVGRKRFSKSLLDQLPIAEIIDWRSVEYQVRLIRPSENSSFDDSFKAESTVDLASLRMAINGDAWGWIKGDDVLIVDCEHPYSAECRWIVFSRAGRLFRCQDFIDLRATAWKKGVFSSPALDKINKARLLEKGFRNCDQLFIGV